MCYAARIIKQTGLMCQQGSDCGKSEVGVYPPRTNCLNSLTKAKKSDAEGPSEPCFVNIMPNTHHHLN